MSNPQSAAVPSPTGDKRRYPGVRAFEEQDRKRFFGRTRASEELLLRVLSVRLLLQFAPSGVGKTSLLNAGLFPRLREHNCFPFIVRLNETHESLVDAVRRSLKAAADKCGLEKPIIPQNAGSLWDLLAGVQLWSPDLLLLTPVLVFDQFEEVFTLRDDAFRKEFAQGVGELTVGRAPRPMVGHQVAAPDLPVPDCKIIISLREEYLGKLEEFTASIPDLFHERLRLSPLSADEAREAIVEPALLTDDTWFSPPFEFEAACLDQLIDFIDGTSETFKVIEPLTLQLVCQQAEELATGRAARSELRPKLTFDDFAGVPGLERLVRNYFTSELDKLSGPRTRRQARELFEQGLLDPGGKRLMLEQGEIERRYGLDAASLNALVGGSLLRREPRNESVFYEISHDRLAEAIAANRWPALPRWVKPTIAAGVVFILVASYYAYRMNEARQRADIATMQAVNALRVLLGEGLVSRLREAGLSDALQGVLRDANIDGSSNSPALALSLRHEGDIARDQATVAGAREKFQQALAVIDDVSSRDSGSRQGLLAERARTLERLASLSQDSGNVSEAGRSYVQSVQAWDEVLRGSASAQERLDAAETRIKLGGLRGRVGDTEGAESAYAEALRVALDVLTKAYDRAHVDRSEGSFELGRAMQIYADAALGLAGVWNEGLETEIEEIKGALALARESLRLRPLSSTARIQVGVASANYGATVASSDSTLALQLLGDSRRQFDELTQFDRHNLRLQRERAALRVLIADGTADCAQTPACRTTLGRGALEEAEIATLDATGNFRRLAALDGENHSLKQDIAWALQVQANIARALGKPDRALLLLDQAFPIYRESMVDQTDIQRHLNVFDLYHDKAQLLEEQGKPVEALAVLDECLVEIDRLDRKLPPVAPARFNVVADKIALLKKIGRAAEVTRLTAENERLQESMGTPWAKKRDLASSNNEEGVRLHNEAAKLTGLAAVEGFQRAREKYELAIAAYPYERTYWSNLRNASDRIALLEQELEKSAGAPSASPEPAKTDEGPDTHTAKAEAALRSAVTAAWMAGVLSDDEQPTSWKDVYEARRSLAQFLRAHDRTAEVLPLVEQGVLDAEEFARQQPGSTEALALLADANVGLSMLRSEAKNGGWEEPMRKGLAYGDELVKREPASSERRRWVGGFRRELGDRLREAQREDAAVEEYRLGAVSCRDALRLAATRQAERDGAQSCLDELAAAGVK